MSASPPLVGARLGSVPALDGVRGVAILMVMTYHFMWQVGSAQDVRLAWLFGAGWAGVDLFFVLSGFLITGILYDSLGSRRFFRNFYVRRVLRIFPVYYATLAFLFLVLPLVLRPVPADLADTVRLQPWYWLYGVNIMEVLQPAAPFFHTGHLWSLSVEEQFYLAWPLLIWLVPRRYLVHLCMAAIAVGIGFRAATWALHVRPVAQYVLTPARLDALAAGALLALLVRSAAGSAFLRRNYQRIGIVAFLGLLPMWIYRGRLDYRDPETLIAGLVLIAVAACALIAALLDNPDRPVLRPFQARWLRYVGRVSYGTYIFHWILVIPTRGIAAYLRTVPRPFGSLLPIEFGWMLFMISLSVGVASVSFYLLERPFLRLKDRFAPAT